MLQHQQLNKLFYRLAAIAAFITVATNIYIHITDFPAETFEERVLLFKNNGYILNRVLIIVHSVLVIVSMTGMGLLLARVSKGFALLGLLSFIVFGLTEMARMVISLNYINGLRGKYFTETNEELKKLTADALNNASLINDSLFRIFIVAFALGVLWYSIILITYKGQDRLLGLSMLLLSLITLVAFINDFAENRAVAGFVHWSSLTLQPFVRLWSGIWIIQKGIKEH